MTDKNNDLHTLFQNMIKQSQDMMTTLNPALKTFSTKGFEDFIPTPPKQFMEAAFGKTINPNGLDAKTRLLVTLAALVTQGSVNDTALKMTIRSARAAGAGAQETAETIACAGLFAGVPPMQKAMDIANQVYQQDADTDANTNNTQD